MDSALNRSKSLDSTRSDVSNQNDPSTKMAPLTEAWEPGVLKRLPIFAVLALIGIISCVLISTLTVVFANNSPVESWKLKPTVLLALSSAFANMLLVYVFSVGLPIAWWRQALYGSTLGDLHKEWSNSRSFFGAFASGRLKSPLVLASILSTIAILDGPLLQKALSTNIIPHTNVNTTMIAAATVLPRGYSGRKKPGTVSEGLMASQDIYTLYRQIEYNFDVLMWELDCKACDTTLLGIGLMPVCEVKNLSIAEAETGTGFKNVFEVKFDWNPGRATKLSADQGESTGIFMNITFTDMDGFSTPNGLDDLTLNESDPEKCIPTTPYVTIVRKTCELIAVPLRYNIMMRDHVVIPESFSESLGSNHWNLSSSDVNWAIDVAPPARDLQEQALSNSTWGGFYYLLSNKFSSSVAIPKGSDFSFEIFDDRMAGLETRGSFAISQIYLRQLLYQENEHSNFTYRPCNIGSLDPTKTIMDWSVNLLFRVSRDIPTRSDTSPAKQSAEVTWVVDRQVYIANYKFLAGGVCLMLLAAIAVARTLWGWWELGREVSISPLETACALGAPILQTDSSATSARKIVHELGDVKVAYGEVVSPKNSGTYRRLALSHIEGVRRPGTESE